MKPEARKYLYDIRGAVDLLTDFTAEKTFADYEQRDSMLCTLPRAPVSDGRHFPDIPY